MCDRGSLVPTVPRGPLGGTFQSPAGSAPQPCPPGTLNLTSSVRDGPDPVTRPNTQTVVELVSQWLMEVKHL